MFLKNGPHITFFAPMTPASLSLSLKKKKAYGKVSERIKVGFKIASLRPVQTPRITSMRDSKKVKPPINWPTGTSTF